MPQKQPPARTAVWVGAAAAGEAAAASAMAAMIRFMTLI
jgi:hypothetical protein